MSSSEMHLRLIGRACRAETVATDPLEAIATDHAIQRELCDMLEHIADELPACPFPALVTVASGMLRRGFRNHVRLEEDHLFPLLRARGAGLPTVAPILEQLEHEHEIDEPYAEDIADALERLVDAPSIANPEMLGYMLRGFFVSHRRHIDWEDQAMLPLARALLTADDLAHLRSVMRASDGLVDLKPELQKAQAEAEAETVRRTCSGQCDDCKRKQTVENVILTFEEGRAIRDARTVADNDAEPQ